MKFKIAMELPTREKLVAGLTPRELHPPLLRAEQAAVDADQTLAHRRGELAVRERTVADMPARIHRGEVKANVLADALRERDAAALLVGQSEDSATSARTHLAAEEKNAKAAVDREFGRRVELLERAAAEVAPVLDEIRELAAALGAVAGSGAILFTIAWPDAPATDAQRRNHAGATPQPLAYGDVAK